MKRKPAAEIALSIAEALSQLDDGAMRYEACRKIVAHAIRQDRSLLVASAKRELSKLHVLTESYRRDGHKAAARSLTDAAKRIETLSIANARLRADPQP